MTFGVSRLLPLGWQAAFLVYTFGLVVLALYLLFVPYNKVSEKQHEQSELTPKLSSHDWQLSLAFAFVAGVIVLTYIAINLRVPGIVEKSRHGDGPDCRCDSFLDAVDWDCSGYQLC